MIKEKNIKCPCCYAVDYDTQYKVGSETAANELSSSDEKMIIDRVKELIIIPGTGIMQIGIFAGSVEMDMRTPS